ncbi:hypothetical protein L7F22_038311 [Adiantum nelumboides]|nr:hypothetical protein [Adiantum nelumboides]
MWIWARSQPEMSTFQVISLLHSCVDVVFGSLTVFFLTDMAAVALGKQTARKLLGSTPHDQPLIKTSEALFDVCYVFGAIFLFMCLLLSKAKKTNAFSAKGGNFDELYLYCFYVAGTVGLMTVPVMGVDPQSQATTESVYNAALALGISNHLTNILPDVGEE